MFTFLGNILILKNQISPINTRLNKLYKNLFKNLTVIHMPKHVTYIYY